MITTGKDKFIDIVNHIDEIVRDESLYNDMSIYSNYLRDGYRIFAINYKDEAIYFTIINGIINGCIFPKTTHNNRKENELEIFIHDIDNTKNGYDKFMEIIDFTEELRSDNE